MKRAYHFKILWLMRRTAGDIWDFDRIIKVDKREFKAVTSYGLSRQRWLIIAEKKKLGWKRGQMKHKDSRSFSRMWHQQIIFFFGKVESQRDDEAPKQLSPAPLKVEREHNVPFYFPAETNFTSSTAHSESQKIHTYEHIAEQSCTCCRSKETVFI